MRVLVTGHRGYIGVVLAPMLQARGCEVVGVDADWFAGCDFGGAYEDPTRFLTKDVRDLEPADLEGVDAVCHLAALSNDPLGDIDAALTHEINHVSSVRLAEQAKAAGVRRFLFSSSCSTYGAAASDDFLDEEAPLNPVTPYGVSKVATEGALSALADDDFSPVYLRNATACGISRRLRVDLVLNNLTAWAVTTGKVRLLSDGTPWRPLVHVEDIARAFVAILEAPSEAIHDEAFNVGRTEENFRIRELAEIVAGTVPGCELEIAAGAGPDSRTYRVDFSKIGGRVPGFQPRWTARSSAQEIYDSYRAVGLTAAAFQGSRYTRLATIRELLAAGRLSQDLRWSVASTVPES